MNVRQARVTTEGMGIFLLLGVGHGTEPIRHRLEMDPATALALASQLEAAVHRLETAGLPLWQSPELVAPPKADAAAVAAAAALPIATDF
jgi:hypothetical protein